MVDAPKTGPPGQTNSDYERQLREINEALLVSSIRQQELAEQAQNAERTLAKALAYGDDIIATLREPFLILDQDLRVKTANRAFYDSFLVAKEETENRLVYDLGNGQWDILALRKLLDEVLSRNQSIHDFEVEHSFPTLGRKTMLLNARPFPPDSKHPELILLAVYDISAACQRAEELADLHRRKDEFLAMLSHELRNPLAAISNAATLLRLEKGGENPLQRQGRTVIERQLAQLVRLVDDLLEISRITTGRVQLRQDRLAVGGVVERAIEAVEPLVNQRQLALTASLPAAPIWVFGDAARLEQVVVNLLNNSAKYTEPGGRIWLGLEQEGGEAVLRVRDTGVGIAPELLPRVFDLFTQAERTLDRSQGGLGIGLALVHRLVEMHGGRVEALSSLGQGSEFVVRLPVMSPPEAAPPEDIPEAVEPAGPSLRVLVIEDNVDAAYSLVMLLKATGHEVRMAHDGPSGWQAALDFRPDALLLDIGLPGFDGYEIARRVRASPELAGATLIAVTGYSQGADRERSSEARIDHHIAKPAKWETLRQILATVATARAKGQ